LFQGFWISCPSELPLISPTLLPTRSPLISDAATKSATSAGFPADASSSRPDRVLLFKDVEPSPALSEPELRVKFVDIVLPALAKLFVDVTDAPAPFPNFSLFTSKFADVLLDDAPALVAEPDCEDKLRLVGASVHVMGPECEDDFNLAEPPSPHAKPEREVKHKLIDASSLHAEPEREGKFNLKAPSSHAEPEREVKFSLGEPLRPMLIEPDCEVIHCLADTPPSLLEPDREVDLNLVDGLSSTSSGSASPRF